MAAKYSIAELQSIVEPLTKKYGAERIYLFGSYARSDMNDRSDIDLRIDKGLALAGLLVDLEGALGMPVDLIPTTSLDPHFLESIHSDEVLLYEVS